MTIQLGILQCDYVSPDLKPHFGGYPEMFQSLLTTNDVQPRYHVYDLMQEVFPDSAYECDGWLLTGSRFSVYDDARWIHRAHKFVRSVHEAGRPLIGICFGHQMIARALGGRVEKAELGWEVGLRTARIFRQTEWMEPREEALSLLVTHQDQVVEPPGEAVVLAGHDFCPFAMLQIDEHILTFQGHPEFSVDFLAQLIQSRVELIGESRAQQALESMQESADSAIAAKWILAFLQSQTPQ